MSATEKRTGKIINLTSHLRVLDENNEVKQIFPSAGTASVATSMSYDGYLNDIPLVRSFTGAVNDLPAPQEGVWYIVSKEVWAAAKCGHDTGPMCCTATLRKRDDLLVPCSPVYDEEGEVIGYQGFMR